jgi:hypothetical protein
MKLLFLPGSRLSSFNTQVFHKDERCFIVALETRTPGIFPAWLVYKAEGKKTGESRLASKGAKPAS